MTTSLPEQIDKPGPLRAFESVEWLEKKVDEYIELKGVDEKPPTLSGFAFFLGVDRRTLNEYHRYDNGAFSPTIKRITAACETWLVENMLTKSSGHVGNIFELKNNHGYKDVQEVKQTGNVNNSTDSELTAKLAYKLGYREGQLEENGSINLPVIEADNFGEMVRVLEEGKGEE